MSGSRSRPTKRRKTRAGANDDEDIPTPQAQANAPSATALSARTVAPAGLQANETTRELTRSWLKALPDTLLQKLFFSIRASKPALLTHALIVSCFLRCSSIQLDSSMPAIGRVTIASIRDSATAADLQELILTDFEKEPDNMFASMVAMMPSLKVLVLRGCTKVGQRSADAVAKHCPQLTVLNLSYTSVLPANIAPILRACANLQTLKCAGISSWTDAAFAKLQAALNSYEEHQLIKLQSLKLRQTFLSDHALGPFIALCPNLKRVDLSFTLVRRPSQLLAGRSLEKLSLNSTKISGDELLSTVQQSTFQNLNSLNIAALGGGQGSSAAISNSSAMSMSDDTLRALTDLLATYPPIDQVNLVGNTKLGITGRQDRALADFVRRVGRRCKVLNLSNITSLRSSDLEGLQTWEDETAPARLQLLSLNNTSVDDDAAPYIASCPHIETLAVGGTKFTGTGLFPIIDACPRLQKLDLTSCRGVRVGDRRRFFEVWQQER
ncbi:RNI-like protein [Wolfiporia cocos MD-104 SS10]|uniref:RNI-like protein n=1 Tax=Wolfiporia cocos (strain MD-104) TaxID=742152 RepID=A0A2H3IV35_WOLCO|nr:RNI-like protein [Wolfiporia cocos MD-104 SS10]